MSKTQLLNISPNPANTEINVNINPKTEAEWTVKMFNRLGQTVYVQKGASNQFLTIDAAPLINGLYIVQYASGGMVRTEKVMIQH